ncbi:MAG: anti-sigma factor [Bacteroidota bacterium]
MADQQQHINPALLEQYILGLTSNEENKEIESYLSQHPQVAKEVKDSQTMIEDFAMEYAMQPPETLKGQVLEAVKTTPKSDLKVAKGISFNWLTSVAATLALGFGILTFLLYQQQSTMGQQIAQLTNQISQIQQKNTLLVNQKAKINQQFAVLKDVNTNHVHLRGSKLSPQALIVVYWNEEDKDAYLNVVQLPEIPQDKSLQLWADVDGKMISMGVLEEGTDELLKVPFIPNADALNITLEPKGGSEHPDVSQIFANGKML